MYYCGWVVCTLLLEVIVCEVHKRYKRFKQWYRKLREEGLVMGVRHAGPWYSRYNRFNCIVWALHNSGTHTPDGKNI
jgi:hypothetical protein